MCTFVSLYCLLRNENYFDLNYVLTITYTSMCISTIYYYYILTQNIYYSSTFCKTKTQRKSRMLTYITRI